MRSLAFRNLALSFFAVFATSLSSQVLLPTSETAFESHHHFNPSFIRAKGIRKITYEIIDKKDFEVAVDKSLTEIYEFNPEGQLTRHYYTLVARAVEKQTTTMLRRGRRMVKSVRTSSEFEYDTIGTNYMYSNSRLILQRYHDGRGYYESRYFRYDTAGHLTRELRYRETNGSANKSMFILGSQTLLSEDTFQYVRFPSGQLKCIFLNNENRPYKERIMNHDEAGRVKEIFETYTAASWISQAYRFRYAGSKMVSAEFEGNASVPVKLRTEYEYDETQELYGEKHYRDSVLVKEVSYVTEKPTRLLNSFVIRDHLRKTMRIVRLRYDFGLVSRTDERRL